MRKDNPDSAMSSSPRRPAPANQLTGDDSGALGADVVVFNQGLQVGLFGGEEGFAVEGGGQGLVFGRHAPSLSVHGPRKSEPSARVLPPGQLRRKE